jgi:SAM-dependent methyltransferase
MGTLIHDTVPWGRNLDEYVAMFGLSDVDLNKRILDCGGGPASFNAEMTARGGTVVSCDPIYQFTREQIEARIEEVYPLILREMQLNHHTFVWDTLKSPEHVGETRMAAMRAFLADFDAGKADGRHLNESLPHLPFPDGSFDLALSSHLLFLYSAALSLDFHLAAIREMMRVAKEARIYPLTQMGGGLSAHVAPVIAALTAEGYQVEKVLTTYEFQKGATDVLRVRK